MKDSWLGIPFKEGGESREEGMDCKGLVVAWLREHGQPVDDLVEEMRGILWGDEVDGRDHVPSSWSPVPVEECRPGDVVLMNLDGSVRHVGVVSEPGYVLHAERPRSCKRPLRHIRRFIDSVWRRS